MVDEKGLVGHIYSRFEVSILAAAKIYNNLDESVTKALQPWSQYREAVLKRYPCEILETIINRLAEAEFTDLQWWTRCDQGYCINT